MWVGIVGAVGRGRGLKTGFEANGAHIHAVCDIQADKLDGRVRTTWPGCPCAVALPLTRNPAHLPAIKAIRKRVPSTSRGILEPIDLAIKSLEK